MKKSVIPKWLTLQSEIDCLYWMLGEMLTREKKLTPIETIIDKSTGYDKEKMKNAKQIIAQIEKLKKEFYKLRPELKPKVNKDSKVAQEKQEK